MAETHLNTYRADVEEAYKAALGAMDAYHAAVKALGAKLDAELKRLRVAAGETAPAAPSEAQAAESAPADDTQISGQDTAADSDGADKQDGEDTTPPDAPDPAAKPADGKGK